MANTAEGLTVGGAEGELDPNDNAAFQKIMEGRGVAATDEDSSSKDTSIASGLTVAGPEQPQARDQETGKFVSNQEKDLPAPAAPVAATDTSGEEHEGDFADPAVQEFLQKYGGNVEEALKGAASAQALIGRRDEEREKLVTEVAELRGKVDGLATSRTAAAPLSDEQVAETAATRIASLGYEGAATEAANYAHAAGDERALQTVLEQWQLESPFAAMNFLTEFRLWQREEAAAKKEPEAQPAWMQTAAEQVAVDALTGVIESVAAERGVPKDSPIIEQMLPALEKMPKNILAMVDSNDPEAQADGVRLVMDRATIMAGTAAAVKAVAPAEPVTPTGAVARKLAGAAVASGALRPAPVAAKSPQTLEEAKAEFKRQIVDAPTTNISSGLTYGPQP